MEKEKTMNELKTTLTRIVTKKPELLKNLNISILQLRRFVDHLIENGVIVPVRCCDCKYGILDDEEAMYKCVYSAEFDEGISELLELFDYNDGDHFCSYGKERSTRDL